jgi:putative nucleotidyltransferase with HDIG domain
MGLAGIPDRPSAWDLVREWTPTVNLQRHMLAVEAAMRAYAGKYREDPALWGVVGLLHDFDYERYPSQEAGHPFKGVEHLRSQGTAEIVCRAILSHASYSGVGRENAMEHALHACDELTGFLTAIALVRPGKTLADVDAGVVRKKMKDKAFARAVDRNEMLHAVEPLGVPFEEHVTIVIEAMRGIGSVLGLAGDGARPGAAGG